MWDVEDNSAREGGGGMSTEISIGCGVSMYTIGQALSNIKTIYSNLSLPPVDVGCQPLKTPPYSPSPIQCSLKFLTYLQDTFKFLIVGWE